ncbi:hypothetical protein BKA70DRAFT_1460976 [Coprinopsis sp. MPI-PUGE-AT-0042]|nr:hypothetical protein BKA70DRAFT_1460976 [Coprinopsis sp. MPI-PUGE-AT-0042]
MRRALMLDTHAGVPKCRRHKREEHTSAGDGIGTPCPGIGSDIRTTSHSDICRHSLSMTSEEISTAISSGITSIGSDSHLPKMGVYGNTLSHYGRKEMAGPVLLTHLFSKTTACGETVVRDSSGVSVKILPFMTTPLFPVKLWDGQQCISRFERPEQPEDKFERSIKDAHTEEQKKGVRTAIGKFQTLQAWETLIRGLRVCECDLVKDNLS